MLQIKKNKASWLVSLAFMGAATMLSTGAYAQDTETGENDTVPAKTHSIELPPVPEPSAFNYVTIEKILTIDETRAWREEMRRAQELGLPLPTMLKNANADELAVQLLDLGGESDSAAKNAENLKKERESLRQELLTEVRKELNQINSHNQATQQASEKIIAEEKIMHSARLVSLFGVGSAITAQVRYGEHDYIFRPHSKFNLRPNSGNELRLVSWQPECVLLFDVAIEKEIKVCISDYVKLEEEIESKEMKK